MGKFGWSYPPGCDGPPDGNAHCEVCGEECGVCKCPECPDCGTVGDLKCYEEHGLKPPDGLAHSWAPPDPEPEPEPDPELDAPEWWDEDFAADL